MRTGKSFSSSNPVRCSRWTMGRLNVKYVSSSRRSSSVGKPTSFRPRSESASTACSCSSLTLSSAQDASNESRAWILSTFVSTSASSSRLETSSSPASASFESAHALNASAAPPSVDSPTPPLKSLRGVALPPNSLPPQPSAGPSAHSLAGVADPSTLHDALTPDALTPAAALALTPPRISVPPPPLTLSVGDLSNANSVGGPSGGPGESAGACKVVTTCAADPSPAVTAVTVRSTPTLKSAFHPETASNTPVGTHVFGGGAPCGVDSPLRSVTQPVLETSLPAGESTRSAEPVRSSVFQS